ncbi:MAG: hypothetical protein IPM18_04465 [Phycisphaerales bacterium]|nr:hypothetical protein [Phycisphaerales bacterium]
MKTRGRRRRTVSNRGLLLATLGLLLQVAPGCGRTLKIGQDLYINTAPHANRPEATRTGEPLEVTVVVVYGEDLQKPGNELLRPGSQITSRDWYARRPQPGGESAGRTFDLPKSQIYVLTNDPDYFGKHIGSALRGGKLDGETPIEKKNAIDVRAGALHSKDTVIYVFPRFINREGVVLPVAPATFHPPGAYEAELHVRIGVRPGQPLDQAQFIEVLSPRKL